MLMLPPNKYHVLLLINTRERSALKTEATKGRSSTLQLLEFQVVIPNSMLDKEAKYEPGV